MTAVLVRFEAALLDHSWHDEARVTRTPLVDALIGRGMLTVLAETDETDETDETETEAEAQVEVGTPAEVPAPVASWFGPETDPKG